MTRVFERPQSAGGTRLLILGAANYQHARKNRMRVPQLAQISSATQSALMFASLAVEQWRDRFPKPLASVDLLVDDVERPSGALFSSSYGNSYQLDPPSISNVIQAQQEWMRGAGANDVLVFYCCGHGINLKSTGKTFLTASFGQNDANPWPDAIALEDFATALGEYPPRQQWLIFDCCNNTPTDALRQLSTYPNPLIVGIDGQRKLMADIYGPLCQITISAASLGSSAFGKVGRPSRLMEVFAEACAGAGTFQQYGNKWWIDQQGLERAMASYRHRIASPEEQEYFYFPRLTQTDAADVARFLIAEEAPKCCFVVHSIPPYKLKNGNLEIRRNGTVIGGQKAGPTAEARFRLNVEAWQHYDVEMSVKGAKVTRSSFALPPYVEELF